MTTKLDTSLINDDQLINDQKIVDVYGNRDERTTYAENLNVYYEFSINWKKYENEEGPVESVPIELETRMIIQKSSNTRRVMVPESKY